MIPAVDPGTNMYMQKMIMAVNPAKIAIVVYCVFRKPNAPSRIGSLTAYISFGPSG
jgi:hypothetical protein